MTLLGLLPPAINDEGDILYSMEVMLTILPVDVMTSAPFNADMVIAVDVENKDLSAFTGMTHIVERGDYGLVCQRLVAYYTTACSSDYAYPTSPVCSSYSPVSTTVRQLRAAARDHVIDLYIRPNITGIGLTRVRTLFTSSFSAVTLQRAISVAAMEGASLSGGTFHSDCSHYR